MPITLHHVSPVVPAVEGLSPSPPSGIFQPTYNREEERGAPGEGEGAQPASGLLEKHGRLGEGKGTGGDAPRLGGLVGGLGGWVGGVPRRQRGRGQRGGR